MNFGKSLTFRQMVFMLYLARSAAIPFFYPKPNIIELGMSAWQFILVDALYALVGSFVILKLMSRYPGENVLTIFPKLLGKYLGKLLLLVLMLYLLSKAVILVRGVADVARLSLLQTTPQWVIATLFLLPVAYTVAFGLTPLARTIDLVLVFGFPMIILSLSTMLPNIDFDFMTNLWTFRPDAFISFNLLATFPYSTCGALFFLIYPGIQATTKEMWQGSIIAVAISTAVLYFPAVYLPQLTFGPEAVLLYRAPLYSAIEISPVSFYLVENVSVIFYSVWNLVSFAASGLMLHLAMQILFSLLPIKQGKWLIPFALVGPLAYLSTFETLTKFLKWLPYLGMLSMGITVFIPLLLYFLSRMGSRSDQNEHPSL
jgi:hypothetical protein